MRRTNIVLSQLILFLAIVVAGSAEAQAEEKYEYLVKRGEVWDWHDVLGRSDVYPGWNGIGLAGFLASINGYSSRGKLPFGTTVSVLPLDQLVASAKFPGEVESHVSVIVEARKLAIALEAGTSRNSYIAKILSDEERAKVQRSAEALNAAAAALRPKFPRASTQAKRASEILLWIESRGDGIVTHKDNIGILNRTGWALHQLHRETNPKKPR